MRFRACSATAFAIVGAIANAAAAQGIARPHIVISVGHNVNVSGAMPGSVHEEPWAAGDPDHQGRLMACSHANVQSPRQFTAQNCYASFDDGASWQKVLEITPGSMNGDPVVTYGRGDTVYVTSLMLPPPGDTSKKNATTVYRSADGGRTWTKSGEFGFIDREYVVVDKTHGKYAGRVYIHGQTSVPSINGAGNPPSVALYTSKDAGESFAGPMHRAMVDESAMQAPWNGVVLSDGTLVFVIAHTKAGRRQSLGAEGRALGANNTLEALWSTDGGATLSASTMITQWFQERSRSEGAEIGMLAVDPGSASFKDRIYAVWSDFGAGRYVPRLAYSSDKGKPGRHPSQSATIVIRSTRPTDPITSCR